MHADLHGKPVQVDPIKPTLTAPGIKLFKLKCDKPLSKFAFKFNLRRNTSGAYDDIQRATDLAYKAVAELGQGVTLVHFSAQR